MPEIIQLTAENIQEQDICCAISDKKSARGYTRKKNWLVEQFEQGYVFKKLNLRGKVFIEYCPVETGWLPIEAPNYMLINCFWVAGAHKRQGHGETLLNSCARDARAKGKDGLVVVVTDRKRPFLNDKKFFVKQGFELADTAEPYFELWYTTFSEQAITPKFKPIAKDGICDEEEGLSVYYTHACPYTEYYVNTALPEMAGKAGIPLHIHPITTHEQAQTHFVPHTIHSVFYNGKFLTQNILSESQFRKYFGN